MASHVNVNDQLSTPAIIPSGTRCLLTTVIGLLLVLLLAAALSIPFLFESPTMWYKFGIAKVSLRVGKMLGLTAGLLLLLQLPLAGRLKVLDRTFSLPRLMRHHRWHAWAIALTALIHPACVLLPEGTILVPLEMRYWPEWVGIALLAAILIQFVSSRWRRQLGIAFHTWMPFHRISGLAIAILLIVHVLYVSETFTVDGPPRLAVLVAAVIFTLIWLWIRSGWLRAKKQTYAVSHVESIGLDCTCVELRPSGKFSLAYMPGQFVFVSFRSSHVSREPHAFTLSSTPSRPGTLQFNIRASGDWTRTVARLSVGEHAVIQGPYGRFSHLLIDPNRALILIAGGIGITPMLSMLRFMADQDDPRPITLIWSNRNKARMLYDQEMDALAAKLTGLRRVPIFTHHSDDGQPSGRLNRTTLEALLNSCSRQSAVFLCGPPKMMTQVRTDLKTLGFPARSIFDEAFGL